MTVGEKKSSRRVIECTGEKSVEAMAGLAISGGESGTSLGMIGICGVLPVRQVAGIAVGWKPYEYTYGRALVAGIALDGGVRTEERETILMILDGLGGDVPTLHCVALSAVGAHLAAVNVCMTIGTIFADIGEDRFDMALDAVYFFVHPPQWIFRFIVIEFGYGADRTPRRGGMAIFAGDGQRSVGITGGLLGSGRWLPWSRSA